MGAFLYHGIRFFFLLTFYCFMAATNRFVISPGLVMAVPATAARTPLLRSNYAVLRLTPTHSYRPSLQPEHIQLFCLVSVLYPSDIFLKALQL